MSDKKENQNSMPQDAGDSGRRSNFIRTIIDADQGTGKYGGRVVTRFPPEPNGYLHIGHAKAICVNFGIAADYPGGNCHLRFDDTNPSTEDEEFVESIQADVHWLGFDWGDNLFFASDYFEQFYDYAVSLIKKGKAYVDSSTEEEIRELRGTLSEPGKDSPYRDRSVEENLDLFARMKGGEFQDGAHVLRAKIDMAAANMKMRDPLLYRIRHAHHYRRADDWCIYPMYDFAHCLEDAIEKVTHSICTLEFENNREIYDWVLEEIGFPERPEQTEFARLNLDYTVMSKRKLLRLVQEGLVNGWDDPRLPTIAGMRRRGYRPEAVRRFCDMIGVAKGNSVVDFGKLEFAVRDDLNPEVPRVMAVLDPLRVVITNVSEGQVEQLEAPFYPHDVPKEGTRTVPFSREIYIERDDFMEVPPKGYYRLSPGGEVRLRYAYFLRCDEVIKGANGEIEELRCTIDPETLGGSATDGRKVKGVIHWVSVAHAVPAEVRLYDRLFSVPEPGTGGREFVEDINPDSLISKSGWVEPSLAGSEGGTRFQFERQGYFCVDPVDSQGDALVFNRIVGLRDSWAKKGVEEKEVVVVDGGSEKEVKSDRDRPAKLSRAEIRARIYAENPDLVVRRDRYMGEWGLGSEDAEILSEDRAVAEFFEAAVEEHDNVQGVANWMIHEVLREMKGRSLDSLPINPASIGRLVSLVDEGAITGKIAKEVFAIMVVEGGEATEIVHREGLKPVSDSESIEALIDEVLLAHPDEVTRYQAGEAKLFGFFMGRVMKVSRGTANPKIMEPALRKRLSGE